MSAATFRRHVDIVGTALRGYLDAPYEFEELVDRLVAISDQRPDSPHEKTTVHFSGTFAGHVFTLYDYKGDRAIHIGGTRHLDVDGLRADLLARLAGVRA